ncbi:MAG: MBL fold metallo-hydrolase [Elusimicrobia bacterium]|nr:MBL fold metallo-hydrolase [Elusimicrobiota bacterium]
MKIKFWGVRGSVAGPGEDTVFYGGNTSCIELRAANNDLIILDAGTGIRKLGNAIVGNQEDTNFSLFLSHAHWDHIEGLPFFKPLYFKKYRVGIYGSPPKNQRLKSVINHALHQPYFPVSMKELKADISFHDITELSIKVGTLTVDIIPVNHPSHTVAFRFSEQDKKIIYMTDNELFCPTSVITPYEQLIEFCRNVDILIHDAMYTHEEWNDHKGWGHSSIPNAVQLGLDAQVKLLILHHHDPERTDKQEDAIVKTIQTQIKKQKSSMICEAAREGFEIEV